MTKIPEGMELFHRDYCRTCPLSGGCLIENKVEHCWAMTVLENKIQSMNEYIKGDLVALEWLKSLVEHFNFSSNSILKKELEMIIEEWDKSIKEVLKKWRVHRK